MGSGTEVDALLRAGGSGGPEDVAAALAQARQLPAAVVAFLKKKGARIIVCRGAITDHAQDLRGVHPRNWPNGMTWDVVPGVYLPDRKQVVVATVPGPGGRVLPPLGSGHGSFSLLVHESMHGHDFLKGHRIIRGSAFRDARQADFHALGAYEQSAGEAGLQETYAESAARLFAGDPAVAASWPNLTRFWTSLDSAELQGDMAAMQLDDAEDEPFEPMPYDESAPIGLAEMAADGTISLDLRAEADNGAIGHAAITLPSNDLRYAAIAEHIFGSFDAQEAVVPSGPVLVRPFRR